MKKFGKLEGQKYTFKKGSLEKNKKKHLETFQYIFEETINNKKAQETFQNIISISPTTPEKMINKIMLKLIESIGNDFNLDETKIYSINKFNKLLLKGLKQNNSKDIEQLNIMIQEIKDKKKSLKRKALLNPWRFLKALYLYTISEV